MISRTTFVVLVAVLSSFQSSCGFAPVSLTVPRNPVLSDASKTCVVSRPWSVLFMTEDDEIVDDNFDGVDLLRVFGLRRVRKMIRKFDRERNAAAREAAEKERRLQAREAVAAKKAEREKRKAEAVAAADGPDGDPAKIIIAGAPASGKGTQCELIRERYGVVHLSTGDMLRAAVAAQTEVGKVAKDYMDNGKLVPDDVIIGVVKDRMNQDDCKDCGWLLDGFPRTKAQADALAAEGVSADCFLFLNVPDEMLIERVVGRRSDPETGKIYHLKFNPPPEDDEALLARLVHRSDDTEEKMVTRLEQFKANVDAVKGSYEDIYVDIDGTSAPDEVAEEISKSIDGKIALKKVPA